MALVILALPALSLLFLQNRQVQTRLSSYMVERLSEELQASISIGSIHYSFFRRVQVRDLYLEDANGDTLIYVGLAKIRISQFRPEPKGLTIRKVNLEDAFVNLVLDSANVVNITYFTNRLKRTHVPPEQKSSLHIGPIHMVDSRFSLSWSDRERAETQVDFTHFHLSDLEIKVKELEFFMDTVRIDVDYLSGKDYSGFDFTELTTQFSISKQHMHFHEVKARVEQSTLDVPALEFNFNSFKDFKRFATQVDLNFISRNSDIQLKDLASFVKGIPPLDDRLQVDGRVYGTISMINGKNLLLALNKENSLTTDFTIIGLPDFHNTYMDFYFKELHTSTPALGQILQSEKDTSSVPLPLVNMGQMDFTGNFTGYADQFVASGLLNSEMGRLLMDLSFTPDSIRGVGFQGRLRTKDFQLGTMLNMENMAGEMNMDMMTKGKLYNGTIRARVEGSIDSLEFYNYPYSNITIDGLFTNTAFMGGFSISDPNIKMDFDGKMDFSGEIPEYKFTADVARIRPYFLNLPQDDPNYFASFLVETDLSGSTLDELNGEIRLVNSMFERSDSYVQVYGLSLLTRNTPEASLIQLRSDLINADITGRYKLSDLPRSFLNMANYYLNTDPGKAPSEDSTNYFNFDVSIGKLNPLLDFFTPGLSVQEGSQLSGVYNPVSHHMSIEGLFPTVGYSDFLWHNVDLKLNSDPEILHSLVRADSMCYTDAYTLENQVVELSARDQKARVSLSWANDILPSFRGLLSLRGQFGKAPDGTGIFLAELEPGTVVIQDSLWNIHDSQMEFGSGYFHVENFLAESHQKEIGGKGTISQGNEQDFALGLKNLELSPLSHFTGAKLKLDGEVSGDLSYRRMDGLPILNANLECDSLSFNNQLLGTTQLKANWNNQESSLGIKLSSHRKGFQLIDADGYYFPKDKSVDFDIQLNDFELYSLNPYLEGIASDLQGSARVNLTLDGTLDQPEINGILAFDDSQVFIDFLKAPFHFNDQVRIYRNNLYFENFHVSDPYGNPALINGSISNSRLKDFYISLNIDADGVQCMNTNSIDNEVFYGNIFGTGSVVLKGAPTDLELKIKARLEKDTRIFLPLYNASEVTNTDFITFIRGEEMLDVNEEIPGKRRSGMKMDLEVEVTNDAVVQLIFDPKVGDIIETSGTGNLRITMDQQDGFRIFGDVVLNKGDYLFTLQNVINKRFNIEPGGRIAFNGSPMNAAIDLEAIYTTRAAPYNLYPDSDDRKESLKKRIPVECHLLLEGELQAPSIATGISMPTADAETKDLLENSTSTDEELMRQFLSLLVINNFYSVNGYGTENINTTGNIAGVTASELLSNQLSNWLSQISDDFDIGINYRPGDEITSDEVEVALSTQLLDDRVIISGNVDVGGQETNPSVESSNPYIMGDFDVEFRVTDNVSILAFNRARDELLFETAPYKQGVGISYREEFDNLRQLFERYREDIGRRKNGQKKKEEKEAQKGIENDGKK